MKKTLLFLAVTVSVCGCRATPRSGTATVPAAPPGAPGVAAPANPFAPPGPPLPAGPGGNQFVPPGAVPFNPQQFTPQPITPQFTPNQSPPFVPPGAGAAGAPPAPIFPSTSSLPPREMQVDYRWQPGPAQPPTASVFLMPPVPIVTEERKSNDPPPTAEPPLFKDPGNAPRLYPPEPMKDKTKPSGLPAGIAQFATVTERVASGLRPSLDEGLDWLQANGYRTVLCVHQPNEDDSADRTQVEKRGMKYVSIGVSPLTLTKEVVDAFNRQVSDTGAYPLFVYDRDGSLAGSLWYLHFRTAEQLDDDAARLRAGRLGLREDSDGPHRLLWLAIQKYLSER